MADSDITVEILKDIRDGVRGTNQRLEAVESTLTSMNERLDITIQRLDVSIQRLDTVESTLLDLAHQQRFIVRYTKAISERDADLPPRVSALESRVDKLESK